MSYAEMLRNRDMQKRIRFHLKEGEVEGLVVEIYCVLSCCNVDVGGWLVGEWWCNERIAKTV